MGPGLRRRAGRLGFGVPEKVERGGEVLGGSVRPWMAMTARVPTLLLLSLQEMCGPLALALLCCGPHTGCDLRVLIYQAAKPARGKEFALIERGSNEAIPIRSA